MGWVTTTLGELSDRTKGTIRTGPFGSQLHESDYSDDGTPVVMPKNIVDGRVSTNGIARIPDEHVARLSQHRLYAGDIVYGRRGDIGRRALITEREVGWLCGTGCLRISLGDSVIDPAFLYYYLGHTSVTAWIQGQAIGATLPNLNTAILRSVPVIFPDLPEQQIIASILSSYDDVIENNTRRIAILEEMARSLYREWFVDFRFPGHVQVPMVESDAAIPTGWCWKHLGEIAHETRQSLDPRSASPETPYVGLEHLPRRSIALEDWGSAADVNSTKLAFNQGDILFGKIRPYFHKVAVAPVHGVCSSDMIVIRAGSGALFPLTLSCVSSDAFVHYATLTSQGTKMPRANWNVLTKYPIAVPPDDILMKFNTFVEDAVGQIQNLVLQKRILRATRDLLLPRLIDASIPSLGNSSSYPGSGS